MQNLNYGIIGNCRSAALVSDTGSIDWCCLPEFDSSSVFAKIIDDKNGGEMSLVIDEQYNSFQSYLFNTNILSTVFTDGKNSFEVLDFMPRYKTENGNYFTPPELYRYIRVKSGSPKIKIRYNPRFNYAMGMTRNKKCDRYIKSFTEEPRYESVYLYSSFSLNDILESNEIILKGANFIVLSYNQKLIDIDLDRVYLEYQRTKVYWLNWVNRSKLYTIYHEEIIRSLLVLKLLSYQRSGAILAAPTTSLPEIIGESRNWDYRFCWLRDASMTLDTLVELGHYTAAKRYMTYIKNVIKSKDESFQIMYGIRGERILTESILKHLAGYENSQPVRIGNDAYLQTQNDIYGFLLDLILQYYRHFAGTLDENEDLWSITRSLVRKVSHTWQNPDHGIWEIRSEKKHYVFSKILCWVALDRGIKIAQILNRHEYIKDWEKFANQIKIEIHQKGWSMRKQSFTQSYGEDFLDASLLQMEQLGFIEADNEKYRSTVLAIKKELYKDGLMYRYKHSDDLGLPASSFTICTFWLVSSLYKIGFRDEARRIFDNLLSFSNHVGLFSEDIDFKTKRLLGNFPQAYSHIALIQTAILLSEEKMRPDFVKP